MLPCFQPGDQGGGPECGAGGGQPASLAACPPPRGCCSASGGHHRPPSRSSSLLQLPPHLQPAPADESRSPGSRSSGPVLWLPARPVTPIASSLPSAVGAPAGPGEDTRTQGCARAETAEGKVRVGAGDEQRTPPCPGTGLSARRRTLTGDSETWPVSLGVLRARLPKGEEGAKFLSPLQSRERFN